MGILDKFKNKTVTVSKYQLITDMGDGFYSYNGNLYHSDIVRSAIRPKAQAIGKIVGKHIRETIKEDGSKDLKVNPEIYMKFLLEEPNPYMTGQMLQEKLAVQLELTNNAFAYIQRDPNGYPTAIYPIVTSSCEAIQNEQLELFLRFTTNKGKIFTFKYTDVIHLRKDFNSNDIFGDNPAAALTPLMEIVVTTDQGIIKAIKNSNIIRWLLKFNQTIRPEDIKKQTKDFVDSFLNTETSETVGAAATDAKMDAKQIEPKDFVPNATQMDRTVQRIYSFFNTNEKIVQAKYSEDDWISYYESSIEPVVIQLSNEYTRKLFSRRERGFGNKIMFESANLSFASMQTKLSLVNYVDRGILNADEVREVLNKGPIPGGDIYVRRLDTRPTTE
ncbi:phage portal protein [Lacrimispora amygdalina]|uniref:Phage portal protein n=1 Tax=Lacrimispora amygdalina TaxID=253257 RepID=A0A3E2NCU1_9FIRM|nr:phage portal protein [Clostridium indicum]RFZ78784.1 phage portal protein [Clostridium indicum]